MRVDFSRSWFVPAICLVITGYFVFHTIQGARGYRRMNQVRAEIVFARQIAEETRMRKELLAQKVRSLSPASLDLDLLEESATRVLNMGNANDFVILLPDEESIVH